jgi:hypothetical protein
MITLIENNQLLNNWTTNIRSSNSQHETMNAKANKCIVDDTSTNSKMYIYSGHQINRSVAKKKKLIKEIAQ